MDVWRVVESLVVAAFTFGGAWAAVRSEMHYLRERQDEHYRELAGRADKAADAAGRAHERIDKLLQVQR